MASLPGAGESGDAVAEWTRVMRLYEAAEVAVQRLATHTAEKLNANIFRLKSRHAKPHDDPQRPWVWELTFDAHADPEFVQDFAAIAIG